MTAKFLCKFDNQNLIMKKTFKFLLVFFLFNFFFLVFSSCHCKKKITSASQPSTAEQKRDFEKEGYVKATVINYEVDGCTFLFKLSDEKKLEPTSLSAEFKKDQLAVWIKYTPKKGAVSTCMAGQVVELSDIQIRK